VLRVGDPGCAPAREEARRCADDALRRDPEHREQQRAEEQQAVLRERGEQLGQQHDERGPDHRAGDRARAADDHHQDEQDRLEEGERGRRDESRQRCEQRARETGARGRERERHGLDRDRVEADRFRRRLGIAHRAHRLAPRSGREAPERVDQHRGHRDREERHPALAEAHAERRRRRDAHDAILPAGEVAPLDRGVLDDEAERDRHHREVGAADAQRREREQRPDDSGKQRGRRGGEPEAHLVRREDRDRIRADRIEAHVPERDLAGEAQQHVEADADDHRQRDRPQDEDVIAVRRCRERGGREKGEREPGRREQRQARRRGGAHTFFTSARPNNPLGRSASAAMTSAKVRMWV
jgi:hypothetical protein